MGELDPESMDLLYGGHPDMSLLFYGRHWEILQNDA